jgi:predicted amidohydrolase
MPPAQHPPAGTERVVRLALVQMACSDDRERNVAAAERHVRAAAAQGAQLVLLPELFEYLYWPQVEAEHLFALAHRSRATPSWAASRRWPRSWAWCCRCRSSSGPVRRTSTA